jgi:hypothetical protein
VTQVVREHRERGGRRGDGEVVVRGPGDGDHARLAAARAWLELGTRFLCAGEVEEALASARDGLEELGPRYADSQAIDDTDLKLAAAEEQIEAGNLADGASVALRVLETRTRLYRDAHADAIVR